MKNQEIISIVLPVYNASKYISKCLDSILNQTHTGLEIIIVDDGSTDDSGAICDYYAEKDERIILLHKENGGLADARNYGLKKVTGKYLGFVDNDDYIEPTMYEKMQSYMEADEELDIVCCGTTHEWEYSYDHSFAELKDNPEYFSRNEALKSYFKVKEIDQPVWNKLFRMSRIKDICFPTGEDSEDIPYVYECLKRSRKVLYSGEKSYHYYHRTGSITGSNFKLHRLDYLKHVKDIYDDVKTNNPDLEEEAHSLYASGVLHMAYVIYDQNLINEYEEQFNQLYSILEDESKYIEKSNSFSKMELSHFYELKCMCRNEKYKPFHYEQKIYTRKKNEFYNLLCQWIKKSQCGEGVFESLQKKGISTVAVYGIKELGELTITELINEGFLVLYLIDKEPGKIQTEYKIYKPDDVLPKVDAIIVTAVHYYQEIKSELNCQADVAVYSLNDLIFDW